jgi:hypothetical protein
MDKGQVRDEELPRQIEKIRVDSADDEKVRKELVNTINLYIRKYTDKSTPV